MRGGVRMTHEGLNTAWDLVKMPITYDLYRNSPFSAPKTSLLPVFGGIRMMISVISPKTQMLL